MDTFTASRHLLTGLRHASTLRFREELAMRIESLLAAVEEDSDQAPASVASLRNLLQFLEAHPALQYPILTLTPGGDFYASWQENRQRVFSIQFLHSGSVRFVVLGADITEQLSGLTTPDMLMKVVAPLNVLEWAAQ